MKTFRFLRQLFFTVVATLGAVHLIFVVPYGWGLALILLSIFSILSGILVLLENKLLDN